MSEIKQTTFRLNEDDANQFREMAEKYDMNQAEMFQGLLNAFEMAKAKNQLADRGKEIDTFQTTVNTLVNMFLNSLEINQTSEERIREVLSLELNTKDNTIKDLQEQKQKLKEESAALKESLLLKAKLATDAEASLDKLNKDTEIILAKLNKDLAEKSDTINSQQSQLQTLNGIIDEYKEYKETYKVLESTITDLNKTIGELTTDNKNMSLKLENETNMKEFYEKEVKELKGTMEKINAENKELDQQHKKELDSLDQGYKQELKAMEQQHKQDLQSIEVKMKESHEKEIVALKGSIEKLNGENKELVQQYRQELEELENTHKDELSAVEIKHQNIIDKELSNLKKNFEDKLQLEKEKLDFAKAKNEAELENIKSKYNDLKEKHDSLVDTEEKIVPKTPKTTRNKKDAANNEDASKIGK